ncbi:proline--tRNA ligase [Candidatus Gracilibacteria bacterium]|nr:proline--tRNA ligase [Candidatus Gracilibacteria bacterium]
MQFRSKSSFQTLKTVPSGSANRSTGYLLQAGYIRQENAGVYNFLPFGLRVMRKIEQIVREEMDAVGCEEILMGSLVSKESMDRTNRWGVDILFKVKGANDADFALGFSHEEVATPLMIEFLQSYKQLPACVYQFQTKFRNEKRAKSGLLRGREFKMKDAYSFHLTPEEFQTFFESMKNAYIRVYERLGIGHITVPVFSDGGEFTPNDSVEFQTFTPIGEDVIFFDETKQVWYNKEIAPSKAPKYNYSSEEKSLEKHHLEGVIGVQSLIKQFNIPIEYSTKSLFYEKDGKLILVVVRSDYDVNDVKLRKIVGSGWKQGSAELIKKITKSEVGYAGLYNLPEEIVTYVDESCESMINFETGGNETGVHVTNCNWGRDIKKPDQFWDLKVAKETDINPNSGKEYRTENASEVGNIFDLSQKYTEAFNLKTTTQDGNTLHPYMGCYGIGISRTMGVIAEALMTEKGLLWPENIAPYNTLIIVHGDNLEKAKTLAEELEKNGKEVLIDDRDVGFGVKMGDADLLGMPNVILLTDKTIEKGGYELRALGREAEIIKMA